jgi:predicted nucleic acid-binding protein
MALGELSALPVGVSIFIDSNILTYHLLNDPLYGTRCKEFVRKVENGEFEGVISPIVVSETLFNLIKATIRKDYHLKPKEIVHFLKRNPQAVSKVDLEPVMELFNLFSLAPISESEVRTCYRAIKDYSLLTNDAFHVATMKQRELKNIATNDPDFERVEWLTVWKP